MIINAPHHTLAARSFLPGDTDEQGTGALEWILKTIQSALCGLHGHDSVLQYERTRMFLRCTSCGHETPGWEVAPNATMMSRRLEARPVRPASKEFGIVRKVA